MRAASSTAPIIACALATAIVARGSVSAAQSTPATSGSSMSALRGWDGRAAASAPATAQPTGRAQPQLRAWTGPNATASESSGAATSSDSSSNGNSNGGATARGRARGRAPSRADSSAPVLPAMRVAPLPDDDAEEPIVIEMFAPAGVTPYAAPFSTRPFGPPARPLRLISSYDGADEDPHVTITIAPALAILREYDGEPPRPPEVRIEVVATVPDNTVRLAPMRVPQRTNP